MPKRMTALSLGAGVQSTTIALLCAEGTLPLPDVAIFADTGWEPAQVYEHLDRLEPVLIAAGIPLLRVSSGNIRRDATDPTHRFASLPWFVKGKCRMCDSTGTVVELRFGPATAEDDEPLRRVRRWLRAAPDTPRETLPPYTGICPNCTGDGIQRGMGRRQCTSEYKLDPIARKIRELLDAPAPEYRYVPRGNVCEQWIGFSTDEIGRVSDKTGVLYLTSRYPLLDLGMSRTDCKRWLGVRRTPDGTMTWAQSVTKSACIGCPYRGNAGWRAMRDNRPDEFADAVAFDAAIRKGGARAEQLDGEAYLHRSLLPLAEAPVDRLTRGEWRGAQTDLFTTVADAAAGYDPDEDGDPDGCRSGEPVSLSDTP